MLLFVDDEMSPEDVIKMVAAALRGHNVRIGHVVADGYGLSGSADLALPNGQTFRLRVEEVDG